MDFCGLQERMAISYAMDALGNLQLFGVYQILHASMKDQFRWIKTGLLQDWSNHSSLDGERDVGM